MKRYKGLDCILLVDDDKATNYFHNLVITYAQVDTHVQIATNAQQALDFLKSEGEFAHHEDFPQPGLILLDINMPGMSGWDFMDAYRFLPEFQKGKMVIAMLTTSLNPDDEKKAKANHEIVKLLHKPLTEAKLIDLIQEGFVEELRPAEV